MRDFTPWKKKLDVDCTREIRRKISAVVYRVENGTSRGTRAPKVWWWTGGDGRDDNVVDDDDDYDGRDARRAGEKGCDAGNPCAEGPRVQCWTKGSFRVIFEKFTSAVLDSIFPSLAADLPKTAISRIIRVHTIQNL